MSAYEKYRYGTPQQPEHDYLAAADPESSVYYTPTGPRQPTTGVEYDHGSHPQPREFDYELTADYRT